MIRCACCANTLAAETMSRLGSLANHCATLPSLARQDQAFSSACKTHLAQQSRLAGHGFDSHELASNASFAVQCIHLSSELRCSVLQSQD